MQRRTFMGRVGTGVAVAATWGVLAPAPGRAATSAAPSGPSADDASVLESLLSGLVARGVGAGYRVAGVSRIERGAVTVTLRRGEQAALVRIFRRSGSSRGLASSAIFDLRLMNGADGGEGTREDEGVAVMTLASRLARLERADVRGYAQAARKLLSSHDEFLRTHGGTHAVAVA